MTVEWPPAEQRQHTRYPIKEDSLLFSDRFGPSVAAAVNNVSAGGVLVQTSRPIDDQREFMLLLFGEGAKDLVCRRVRTVWQKKQPDDTNHAGLAFIHAPSAALSAWIRKATWRSGILADTP